MKSFKTMVIVCFAITAFFIFIGLLIHYGQTNEIYLRVLISFLILVNLYGFLIMLLDKARSSKASNRRISERHLFIASGLGGSLGTLLGMKVGRHKTKHLQFKILFPSILIIQVFCVVYLLIK